jgi:HlyD family secretion protein
LDYRGLFEAYLAQLRITQLGARIDEIRAAEAQVAASKAVLAQAQWKLDQKSIRSPVTGFVQDTFYVQSEWVNAGNPVVSLLPPGNIKVRFFIPEVARQSARRTGGKAATAVGARFVRRSATSLPRPNTHRR